MREFAIININNNTKIDQNILKYIPSDVKVTVFRDNKTKDSEFYASDNVTVVEIPEEYRTSDSKTKNYVSKYYYDNNFSGFLHVIEDTVEIFNDTQRFLEEIETMMSKFRLKSWFNTITDPCNYTFKMYNPRFSVTIDKEEAKKVYDKTIFFTSHANTSWICYDYSIAKYEDIEFDERFTIPMFYIIKFLANRRNLKKGTELHYMNMYPTVEEERNVFRLGNYNTEKDENDQKEEQIKMQIESQLFESMHIDNHPEMQIEPIMDDMFKILTNT